jgi:HEPN domain-containing protein
LKFDPIKTIRYWYESAAYDIAVADALYETGKYPYALFMGHLALEKILKALVVKTTRKHAPYTHSLTLLASESTIKIPQQTMKKLARFMEFHFEARYPDEQKKFYQRCTKGFTRKNLHEMREIYIWLTEKLQKK